MSKEKCTCLASNEGCMSPNCKSKYGYQENVYYVTKKLRAQLLNLTDSVADNDKQREALKGLINDFVNQAESNLYSSLDGFLRRRGCLKDEDHTNLTPRE